MNNLIDKLSLSEQSVANLALNLKVGNNSFQTCTGGLFVNRHHYGTHGLMTHTKEVIEIALELNKRSDVPENEIILAGLFHDTGKVFDYEEVDGKWVTTKHKRLIHHISRGALFWQECSLKIGLDAKLIDDVLHAILAHHGKREYGSPVSPGTKLGWLIHLADTCSARIYEANHDFDFLSAPVKG